MSPLIIALDFATVEQALTFTEQLGNIHCRVKVGKELFTRGGPTLVKELAQRGFDVFLDLKYHDIPHTVACACKAAADLGVWMINVHALGGRDMLLAAHHALEHHHPRPLLVAVSILTSLNEEDLYAVGLHGSLEDNVLRLARLTKACGLDGLVCSPHEIEPIRQAVGNELQLVTPGIRPEGSLKDDQKRIMTPIEALKRGANYLVIGRPVTSAPHPLQALLAIEASLRFPPGNLS
jgi:orotidine-5'-phosphate decarboxylase